MRIEPPTLSKYRSMPVGARFVQARGDLLVLVVDRLVEAELVDDVGALLGPAGDADDLARALDLRDLARGRAGRTGGPGDDDDVALLEAADVDHPEVGGHAGETEHAERDRRRHAVGDQPASRARRCRRSRSPASRSCRTPAARPGRRPSGSRRPRRSRRRGSPRRSGSGAGSRERRPSTCGSSGRSRRSGPSRAPRRPPAAASRGSPAWSCCSSTIPEGRSARTRRRFCVPSWVAICSPSRRLVRSILLPAAGSRPRELLQQQHERAVLLARWRR